MTREEAIKIMEIPAAFDLVGGEIWIQRFVALGMLKLDEPKDAKTAAQRLAEELDKSGYATGAINDFFDCAARVNVKIVEK